LILPPRPDRLPLIREAFRLEWLTIGWMTIEAVVAISAGFVAGSLVVLAFGLDSLIELASAGVHMWRLSIELRYGKRDFPSERNRSPVGSAGPCCVVSLSKRDQSGVGAANSRKRLDGSATQGISSRIGLDDAEGDDDGIRRVSGIKLGALKFLRSDAVK
jgi:hypothetical protein